MTRVTLAIEVPRARCVDLTCWAVLVVGTRSTHSLSQPGRSMYSLVLQPCSELLLSTVWPAAALKVSSLQRLLRSPWPDRIRMPSHGCLVKIELTLSLFLVCCCNAIMLSSAGKHLHVVALFEKYDRGQASCSLFSVRVLCFCRVGFHH